MPFAKRHTKENKIGPFLLQFQEQLLTDREGHLHEAGSVSFRREIMT